MAGRLRSITFTFALLSTDALTRGGRFFSSPRGFRVRGGCSSSTSTSGTDSTNSGAFRCAATTPLSSSATDTVAEALPQQVHIAASDGSDGSTLDDDAKKSFAILQFDMPGSSDNTTSLFGLGTNETYFLRFVKYMLENNASINGGVPPSSADIQNLTVDATEPGAQEKLRSIWKEGRLLVMSNEHFEVILGETSFHQRLDGFTRRMKQYIERAEDVAVMETLRTWLRQQWAEHTTQQEAEQRRQMEQLELDELEQREQRGEQAAAGGSLETTPYQRLACDSSRGEAEALEVLRELMRWFKAAYPYYYDSCLVEACGNTENNSFLGYLAPNSDEKVHNTSRVELIHCSVCDVVSRFPRYNDAMKVLFESRRGRCGEYSVAALALTESLGYTSRWVVDWADHVWIGKCVLLLY